MLCITFIILLGFASHCASLVYPERKVRPFCSSVWSEFSAPPRRVGHIVLATTDKCALAAYVTREVLSGALGFDSSVIHIKENSASASNITGSRVDVVVDAGHELWRSENFTEMGILTWGSDSIAPLLKLV